MNTHHHGAPRTNSATEHLLAVVEPTDNGNATLDLAHDVVARGGQATVLMLITDRVVDDIRGFAAAEDLDYRVAEAHAIERLTSYCTGRVGANVPIRVARLGSLGADLQGHISDDITAVALPAHLPDHHLGRLANTVRRPLVIVPDHDARALHAV